MYHMGSSLWTRDSVSRRVEGSFLIRMTRSPHLRLTITQSKKHSSFLFRITSSFFSQPTSSHSLQEVTQQPRHTFFMAMPTTLAICTTCDESGTLICSGCKSIHYCSKACQKMDWPIHKIICKDYTTFVTTRPDLDHHNAIIFHPDEPKPRFVWLRFDCGHGHPNLDHLAQFGVTKDRFDAGSFDEISHNPLLQRHIQDHHILLSMPEAKNLCPCCNTDVKTNSSLTDVDDELTSFFRGTILAFGMHCEMDFERKPLNLDLRPLDFRYAVDHLRRLYSDVEDPNRSLLEGKGVRAVRLNCLGDTRFLDRPGFESIVGSKLDLTKDSEIPVPVADKIGLPLLVHKMPPAVLWRDPRRPCRVKNFQAGILNPPNQSADTGSLLITRKDGKPLHPVHIHALITYTTERLKHPNHPENACLTPDMLLPDRIKHVSKEDFQKWYPTLWQLFPNCPYVPSPFDINEDFVIDELGFNLRRK